MGRLRFAERFLGGQATFSEEDEEDVLEDDESPPDEEEDEEDEDDEEASDLDDPFVEDEPLDEVPAVEDLPEPRLSVR
ncbi:hypothetical protein [Actinomadura spongiicola]|uniref:hypothetical protein n=1 Tax=Actinomadura spongiicola TaxID=2303421 RepID=UPI0026994BC1|nr:hypothetical protein [Actinomadura spongiicola]